MLSVLSSFANPLICILSLLFYCRARRLRQPSSTINSPLAAAFSIFFFLFNHSITHHPAQTILLSPLHFNSSSFCHTFLVQVALHTLTYLTLTPSIIQLLCRSHHILSHTFIPNFLPTHPRCPTLLLAPHTSQRRSPVPAFGRASKTKPTPTSHCRNASTPAKQ